MFMLVIPLATPAIQRASSLAETVQPKKHLWSIRITPKRYLVLRCYISTELGQNYNSLKVSCFFHSVNGNN